MCLSLSRVLFVCSANLDRSPTAERLFQNWKRRWEARSAGIMPLACNPLRQELIDWADVILVMEQVHSQFIYAHFKCNPSKVRVLNIADRYFRDDPELIQLLQSKVIPILEAWTD
jgi:predicted protein tyrosine phosphatase